MIFSKDGALFAGTLLDEPIDRPDEATAGPILVQGFLQYLFQGVIITQAVKFYGRCEDDSLALRIYVLVLVAFSLLQTVLESYKVWGETILGQHWWQSHLHFTEFLCNALICSLCEVFLIRRCYRLTGKKWLLGCLAALAVTTMTASGILTWKIAMVIGPIADNRHVDPLRASVFAYPLWVYGTLLLALGLTTILSISLWRTKTGLAHLDRTLAHIIAIGWETAALPAACMLVSAVVFSIRDADHGMSSPHPTVFAELNLDLFFAILTGKVYTLGLLRTLNERAQFKAELHSGGLERRSLSGYQWESEEGGEGAGCGEGQVGNEVPRLGSLSCGDSFASVTLSSVSGLSASEPMSEKRKVHFEEGGLGTGEISSSCALTAVGSDSGSEVQLRALPEPPLHQFSSTSTSSTSTLGGTCQA